LRTVPRPDPRFAVARTGREGRSREAEGWWVLNAKFNICCKRAATKDMFKLRDGPLDWYFCDSEHALDWLEHRHSSVEANKLLRMLPDERARALNGRTIAEVLNTSEPSFI
jgi:hypothetical protein